MSLAMNVILHAVLFETFVEILNFCKSSLKGHITCFGPYGHYQVTATHSTGTTAHHEYTSVRMGLQE
jgi:hypothetical protein